MAGERSAVAAPAIGSEATTVWRAVRRDPLIRISVVVLLLSALPYLLPILGEEALLIYGDLSDLPMLALAIVSFQLGRRTLQDEYERRFWNLWSAAFATWVFVRVLYIVVPLAAQTPVFDVLTDLLYVAFYLCIIIALDFEIEPGKRARESIATTVTAGTIVAGFGLLAYFSIIPGLINRENYVSWFPSLLLYALLDLYVLARLTRLWHRSVDRRWRYVYRLLAVTAGFWLITDTLEALEYAEVIPFIQPGTPLDLPWYVPLLTVIIAARVPPVFASGPRSERTRGEQGRRSVWGGSLATYAFLFALAHIVVEMFGLMDAETRIARHAVVLSVLAVLVLLATRRERLLDAQSREQEMRERDLRKQLERARKMEALGTLAGGVAHDFNNILLAIVGYTELAKQKTSDDEIQEELDFVLAGADRASQLVRRITTFARQDGDDLRPVELAPVVREAVGLLRATLPSTIEIREDVSDDCGWVLGDPEHIYQAVVNLGANAGDAMTDGDGVLEVRVEPVATPADLPAPIVIDDAGPYVLVTISDTGSGMEPEIVERIFEPFFTTKDRGRGVGLGLSTVHAIVTRHGGGIRVDSTPGSGTTFQLCFAATSKPEQASAGVGTNGNLSGSERILVVDDEPSLVFLAEQQLTRLGYEVTTETDAERALEKFERSPDDIDLLLTDKTMPGRTGLQLAKAVKAIRPDLPILLTTGHSDDVTGEARMIAGIDGVIPKPYNLQTLSAAIRNVLGTPAS